LAAKCVFGSCECLNCHSFSSASLIDVIEHVGCGGEGAMRRRMQLACVGVAAVFD
jgi:hypothetical protein